MVIWLKRNIRFVVYLPCIHTFLRFVKVDLIIIE